MNKEIEDLTKALVSIKSVNGTLGEKAIADYIESYIRDIPYFKEHPDLVFRQELKDDSLHRANIVCLLKGGIPCDDTIMLHGHIDTVGVEDYKHLMPYAFDSERLMEEMLKIDLPEEVREDLESGDYMVGRGCCDMKSGDAVFLVVLKSLCAHVHDLEGNILVSFNPVEENRHQGIIEEIALLKSLKAEHHLHYLFAINNDYICPLYPHDPYRYIYLGTVGKLLPCFYIQGKEAHVGQPFEGFDASYVASLLVEKISLNSDFCESYKGEYTLPPSVLKIKDLKSEYNVQTSFDAFVYFNYLVHDESVEVTLEKFMKAGADVMQKTQDHINRQYEEYCQFSHDQYVPYDYDYQVISYDTLCQRVKEEKGEKILSSLESMAKNYEGKMDQREMPIPIIKEMLSLLNEHRPTMVCYFGLPYCPHNTLKEERPEEKELIERISSIASSFQEETKQEMKVLRFFPSLSDSSYLKIDDSSTSIACLQKNFPLYQDLYPLPFQDIASLNIPAIDFGCYGKDAHKWSERVYKPYTFILLPQLIIKTIMSFLGKKESECL